MATTRVLFLAAVFCLPPAAFAGDPPPARVEEIVVTPSRHGADVFDLPYRAGSIPEERLSGPEAPRSLPEAVGQFPGVLSQKTANGQGSPYLRGLTGFRTLALVDGIRLNNSVFRDGPNQYLSTVDQLSLGRLEMVGGPASVLYGSDALGGALNMFPLEPRKIDGAYAFGGRAFQRFASAERSSLSRVEGQGGSGAEFGFLLGLSRKSFHDMRDGDGRLPYTGYSEQDADLRCLYDPTDAVRLTFGFQRVEQDDVPRTHRTKHAVPFHGTTVGSDLVHEYDQTRDLAYARIESRKPVGFADEYRVTASWQRQDEVRRRVRKDGRYDRQGFTVDTLGLDAAVVAETRLGTVTFGGDFSHDFVDSFAANYDAARVLTSRGVQGPVADDAGYDLGGIFAQDEADLGGGLGLTVGARGTYARARAGDVLDPETGGEARMRDDWAALAGSARLAYEAAEELRLYGGVSQGFRAPNLSDMTRYDVARTKEIEIPAESLDPEHAVAFELGAKADASPFRGEVLFYDTLLRDFIVRAPTGRVVDGNTEVTKENAGDGAVRGLEVSGEVDAGSGVTLFAGGSAIYGKIDGHWGEGGAKSRDYLDRLPPMMGRGGARWSPIRGLSFTARVRAAAKADKLSPADREDTERIPPGGTPSYAVFDLEATWAPCPWFTVTFSVENLRDSTYRIHGSGVNEPGRNFVLSLEARF